MIPFSRLLRRAISAYYSARFRTATSLACVRVKVKIGRWKNRDPNSIADLNEAIKDLEIHGKDDGTLSLYLVRSRDQGSQVALLHQVTNNGPNEALHILFIPTPCLARLACRPEIVRNWDLRGQHPILNKHHFVVYGMDSVAARRELAAAILRHPDHVVESWSKQEMKQRARAIAGRWLVRKFMRYPTQWQSACFGPDG